MGVISTFDLKFQGKILKKCIDEYGAENVVHIRKSKLFLWIYVIGFAFLWFVTLVAVIASIVLFLPDTSFWEKFIKIPGVILVAIVWFFPLTRIVKYLLDYFMDFSIITPQSFIRYDQTGFFKRTSKVIDLTHVRSVSVEKKGFINSIFNNGNLVVLSEGSDTSFGGNPKEDAGKVYFRYVKNPERYSERIGMMIKEVNYRED